MSAWTGEQFFTINLTCKMPCEQFLNIFNLKFYEGGEKLEKSRENSKNIKKRFEKVAKNGLCQRPIFMIKRLYFSLTSNRRFGEIPKISKTVKKSKNWLFRGSILFVWKNLGVANQAEGILATRGIHFTQNLRFWRIFFEKIKKDPAFLKNRKSSFWELNFF